MPPVVMRAFFEEFEKHAKSAVQLLSSLAKKKGLDPTRVGAINQVKNVAETGNRSRAAEIARNVRSALKKVS